MRKSTFLIVLGTIFVVVVGFVIWHFPKVEPIEVENYVPSEEFQPA